MSHDFDQPKRRWERRVCKRCKNVYSALQVETGMTPACHGAPMAPPIELRGRRVTQPVARNRGIA
jgi:hypothetical protein